MPPQKKTKIAARGGSKGEGWGWGKWYKEMNTHTLKRTSTEDERKKKIAKSSLTREKNEGSMGKKLRELILLTDIQTLLH